LPGNNNDNQSEDSNETAVIRAFKEFWGHLRVLLKRFALNILSALRDLAPIFIVIAFFQIVILQRPFPNMAEVLFGLVLVILGLSLFVLGLEMGLFPIGEAMAHAFAQKGSLIWLLLFAFGLGFATTVAEPALIAVANEAAKVAAQADQIPDDPQSLRSYSFGLRLTVALSVGVAVTIGIFRILKGWPVHYLIIGGYIVVMLVTIIAPEHIIGVAYDSGGVTTSCVTVPLVTALGVGLASSIRERNPLMDGFGLIAFASLLPMIFVMIYGMAFYG
jgi:hypothetical protein